MTKDHVSIVLEVLSFFLVTTDLYGKERLQKLRTKLTESKNGNSSIRKINLIIPALVIVLIFYALGKESFQDYYDYWFNNEHTSHYSLFDWIIYIIVGIGITVVGVFLVFVGLVIVGLVSSTPFLLFTNIGIWLIRQALKVLSLEGLLLTIGTILFLISKILVY